MNRHLYYLANSEHIKKQHRKWREANKEQIKKQSKEYRNRPEVKRRIKERAKIYRQRPEVKQKDREYMRKHYQYPEVKKYHKKHLRSWQKTHPEKIAEYHSKRRKLGHIELNEQFKGSHGHHIDFEYIIYIPIELHNSVKHCVWTGYNMEKINDKAVEWLIEHGDFT